MRFPSKLDDALVELLSERRPAFSPSAREWPSLLQRAELHGLGGVVEARFIEANLESNEVQLRRTARELDHVGHLALLERIDATLHRAKLQAVSLKGALFAERYYPVPWGRSTSDVDLMVNERDIDLASATMTRELGYVAVDAREQARLRKEHHNLELHHDSLPLLELHFHAHRGFGLTLPSEPFVARSVPFRSFKAIRVLSIEDELVFLAIHAASHRYVRLGWLYDIWLLTSRMTEAQREAAAASAHALGCARVLSFTLWLVSDLFDNERDAQQRRRTLHQALVRRILAEPPPSLYRTATRLAFTVSLCDTPQAARTYVRDAVASRVRGFLERGPG